MASVESLTVAVASDDRRRALVALRDRLAVEVERVADEGFCVHCKRGSSSVAAVAKQLRDVLADLEALPAVKEGDDVDDLASRRAARRSAAAGS